MRSSDDNLGDLQNVGEAGWRYERGERGKGKLGRTAQAPLPASRFARGAGSMGCVYGHGDARRQAGWARRREGVLAGGDGGGDGVQGEGYHLSFLLHSTAPCPYRSEIGSCRV